MDNPFFTNRLGRRPYYYKHHSPDYHYPAAAQPVSIHPPVQNNPAANAPSSSSSKVVQIPVHFVNSETPRLPRSANDEPAKSVEQGCSRPSQSASAVKIQKAIRGFLVRKSVKRIKLIKKEVDEIEERFLRREYAELVRRDERERLRVNEMLMSLLFKLDSIRGIDAGVRDFRKTVIKKAIALQEKIDAIVAGEENEENESPRDRDSKDEVVDQSNDETHKPDDAEEVGEEKMGEPEKEKTEEDASGTLAEENAIEEEAMVDDEDKESVGTSLSPRTEDVSEGGEEKNDGVEGIEEEMKGERREENKRNRELLEKMMEDNEKMMSLMAHLFDRNEMQTRILESLNQRVERLEKAFVCDKMRRKKKKH